ncbi:hypothetical protein P3T73_05075 [Kiritimatiellota bacterium B12222]|nr:hypothetical protein P3T73_05075 [Kiritimatiellota bacterium B12222]
MTLPLAQSSFTFLIYLAVGAFWLIGNLIQKKQAQEKANALKLKREKDAAEARRTGKPVPSPTRVAPPAPASDLETFLRNLAGEPARPAPPPPPLPAKPAPQPKIHFDQAPPAPAAGIHAHKTPTASSKTTIGEMDMEASFKQISDIKEAAEVIGEGLSTRLQQDALKNVRSMMVDLSSSSVAVPVVPLKPIRAIQTKTNRLDLQKKKTFKKALIASIILEAPKALQENPFEGTK